MMTKATAAVALILGLTALVKADGHLDGSMEAVPISHMECDMEGIMACGAEVMAHPAYDGDWSAFGDMDVFGSFCELVAEAAECSEPILDECPFDDIYMLLWRRNAFVFMCREASREVIGRNLECLSSAAHMSREMACNGSQAAQLAELTEKYTTMDPDMIDQEDVDRDACMFISDSSECWVEAGEGCGAEVETFFGQMARAYFRDSIREHRCYDDLEECNMDAINECTAEVRAHPAHSGTWDSITNMDDFDAFCGLVGAAVECTAPLLDMCPFDDIYTILEKRNAYRFMCRAESRELIGSNWECLSSEEHLRREARCNASMVMSLGEIMDKYMNMDPAMIDQEEADMDACMLIMDTVMCYVDAGSDCGPEVAGFFAQVGRAMNRDNIRHHRCMELMMDDDSHSDDMSDSHDGSESHDDSRPGRGCDMHAIMECSSELRRHPGFDKTFDAFASIDEVRDLCRMVPATAACLDPLLMRCSFDEAFETLEKRNGYMFMCREDTLRTIGQNFECLSSRRQADADRACNASLMRQMMEMYNQAIEENWDRPTQDMRACIFMQDAMDCYTDGAMEVCGGDAGDLYNRYAMAAMRDSWDYHMCDRQVAGGAGQVAAGVLSAITALVVLA